MPRLRPGVTLEQATAERPHCAVIAHFGERDTGIPIDGVRKFAGAIESMHLQREIAAGREVGRLRRPHIAASHAALCCSALHAGKMLADISGEELEQYLVQQGLVGTTDKTTNVPLNAPCSDAEHAAMQSGAPLKFQA